MISKTVLTMLAAAALSCAQTSPGAMTPPTAATRAQMRVNRLATQLTLTDAQKSSALSIFTTAYTNAETPQTNLETARASLQTAIKANNTAQIDSLSTQIGTLSAQLTSIN